MGLWLLHPTNRALTSIVPFSVPKKLGDSARTCIKEFTPQNASISHFCIIFLDHFVKREEICDRYRKKDSNVDYLIHAVSIAC